MVELLENDRTNGELLHYNEIVQNLNNYGMLMEHLLQKSEQQIEAIQELNGWKCVFEEQVNKDKMIVHSLENDATTYKK